MFRAFLRSRPQISIFHHPSSPQSTRALELLRASLTAPYPPGQPRARPLEFDLEVVDGAPPTADQLQTIASYLPTSAPLASAFLSAHPTAPAPTGGEQPQSAAALSALFARTPGALRWPVVVDWMGGRASIGDVDGVRRILDAISKDRGGDANEN